MVPKKDLAWWRPRRSAGINFHELPLAVDYLQSSSKIASFIYLSKPLLSTMEIQMLDLKVA
jgi:hypothetical protein